MVETIGRILIETIMSLIIPTFSTVASARTHFVLNYKNNEVVSGAPVEL